MKINFDTPLLGTDLEPLPKPLTASERETLARLLETAPNTPTGGNDRWLLRRLIDKTGDKAIAEAASGFDASAPFTVGQAVAEALQLEMPGENASLDEKVSRYKLARKVAKGGIRVVGGTSSRLTLTTGEVELIRSRVGKTCKTWIAGQIKDAIDGADVEAEPAEETA